MHLPELSDTEIRVKNEMLHPSGSLKHRLAHALFVQGIRNSEIAADTIVIGPSSGSAAISEAWFAQRLGLKFVAVVPETTAPCKLRAVSDLDAEIILVPPKSNDLIGSARDVATERHGYFMEQFRRASDAPDWRGTNTIASSLIGQFETETHALPDWIVVGAGPRGTAPRWDATCDWSPGWRMFACA